MPDEDALTVRATERWLMRRGLPHFIADYNASHDIWTRALPVLTLLLLVEIAINAPSRDFPVWLDVLVLAGAFAVLLGAWALVNRLRGRRPLARPDTIGPIELGIFLVGSALVPLLAGGQIGAALVTFGVNALLLTVIYFGTSYAVFPIIRWAFGRLRSQLEAVTSLLARALPLVALLVTFLFLTVEVWETAGTIDGVPYWIAVSLFPLVALLFLVVKLPQEIGELNNFADGDAINALTAGTPAESFGAEIDTAADVRNLGRREWGNVGLVTLFSQGVQIALISALIGVFFVLLGVLLVDATTTAAWVAPAHPHILLTISLGHSHLVVSEELLRVAGFLTAFTALNFTVYLLTDQTYRAEFRADVVDELRQAFAVRAVYRAYLRRSSESGATISTT